MDTSAMERSHTPSPHRPKLLRNVTVVGDSGRKTVPRQKYIGSNTDKEPTTNGSGPDGTYCTYSGSDITYRQALPGPGRRSPASTGSPAGLSRWKDGA